MKTPPNLHGREFDWFCFDQNGAVGLFATAGEGFVPACALKNHSLHDSGSEQMETPNWGSLPVWSDIAEHGLYVYDWSLPEGPYVRVSSPTAKARSAVVEEIIGMIQMDIYQGSFASTKEISDIESFIEGSKIK